MLGSHFKIIDCFLNLKLRFMVKHILIYTNTIYNKTKTEVSVYNFELADFH